MSVFISYASEDFAIAQWVRDWLAYENIPHWMAPDSITPGADYASSIIKAIDDCQVMLILFSASSNASPHVAREIERAANRGVPLIPFMLDDTKPSGSMEYFLSNPQWVIASRPPTEADMQKLAASLRLKLKQAPAEIQATAARRAKPKRSPYSPLMPFLVGLGTAAVLSAIGVGAVFLILSGGKAKEQPPANALTWSQWVPAPVEVGPEPKPNIPLAFSSPLETSTSGTANAEVQRQWRELLTSAAQDLPETVAPKAELFAQNAGQAEAYQLQFASVARNLTIDYQKKLEQLTSEAEATYLKRQSEISQPSTSVASKRVSDQLTEAQAHLAALQAERKAEEEKVAASQKRIGQNRGVSSIVSMIGGLAGLGGDSDKGKGVADANIKNLEQEQQLSQKKIEDLNKDITATEAKITDLQKSLTGEDKSREEGQQQKLQALEADHQKKLALLRTQIENQKSTYQKSVLALMTDLRERILIEPLIALGTLYLKQFPDDAEVARRTQDAQELAQRVQQLREPARTSVAIVRAVLSRKLYWQARESLEQERDRLFALTKSDPEKNVVLVELAPVSREIEAGMKEVDQKNSAIIVTARDNAAAAMDALKAFLASQTDWPVAKAQIDYLDALNRKQIRDRLLAIIEQLNPDLRRVEGWLNRYTDALSPDWRVQGLPEPGFLTSTPRRAEFLDNAINDQKELVAKIRGQERTANEGLKGKLTQLVELESRGLDQILFTKKELERNQFASLVLTLFLVLGVASGGGVSWWRWVVQKRQELESKLAEA